MVDPANSSEQKVPADPPSGPKRRVHPWVRRWVHAIFWLLIAWALAAYLLLPALWRHYEHHPSLESAPKTTETKNGIPGDPLNVGLVGTKEEIVRAFAAAHWYPADPVTLASSLKIAEGVVLDRAYPTAPVSPLMLWGRHQDLAFEKPAGVSPRHRQHVRLWQSEDHGDDGQPLWIGAATYDDSVGLSHYTAQVTHHIAADVDAERDGMMSDLAEAGQLVRRYQVTGVGLTVNGHNGGGDRYFTDGELDIGVIAIGNVRQSEPPVELANPPAVVVKNRIWNWFRPLLKQTDGTASDASDNDAKESPAEAPRSDEQSK